MNPQIAELMNPTAELESKLQKILDNSRRPLSAEESQKFYSWLEEIDVHVDYEPQYRDYVAVKSYLEQLEKCNNCDGADIQCSSKQIARDTAGRVFFMACECPVRVAKRIIKAAQVPTKFRNCRIGDFRDYSEGGVISMNIKTAVYDNVGLYLYGAPGTGKTMLSSIIINERAYDNRRSHFYTVTDLILDLQDFENPLRREEKLAKVQSCPCLVIDDMGAENVTNWVATTLFSILDTRYKDNLQTIINSNFSIDALCERYTGYHGERISRRIKAMCKPLYMS